MGKQKNPKTEDGQAFDEGTEPGGARGGQPQNKVDASGFEERNQLWTLALDLQDKRETEVAFMGSETPLCESGRLTQSCS